MVPETPTARRLGGADSGDRRKRAAVSSGSGSGSGSGRGGAAAGLAASMVGSATPSAVPSLSNFVVSVVEFRNRQEVGVAAMNTRSPELRLYQFADNQAYTNTLSVLFAIDPSEILMPDTATGSTLHSILRGEFELSRWELLRRKYFNENQGLEFIERHGATTTARQLDGSKYLCLAAAASLAKYLEFSLGVAFAPKSLRVVFKTLDGHMRVDYRTAQNLEIAALRVASSRHSRRGGKTLLETLDFTQTSMGERLLRQTLLQPLRDLPTIELRLDAVQELLGAEKLFWDLSSLMPQVPDVDLIAASLVQIPSLVTIATAQRNVTNLLSLKKLLELAAAIAPVLQSTRNELLVAIRNTLQDDVANKLRQIVSAVISAESSIGKKPDAVKLRGQLVFALRAGLDGMLDVARTAYLHSIEQMDQLVDTYRAQWSTAALRIEYTPARGFHLSLPRDAAEQLLASEARGSVLEQVWRGKRLYFSTEELLALNSRQSDAFREVLAQTNRVLETTLDAVRQHMSWLFTVTESLALLDMLRAFAHLVSVSDQYVRPLLTADGPLAVRQGRHPVLEKTLSRHSYVPTKVFLAENCCLQVLTAPNNGGKSTYLRQIGLLVILAHSGCFVPAEWASVRVTEQLFARMTTDDEMEANAGSFMVEMRETAHIIESATARSLVLIDELGRGTSMGDGLALAWSVCEALLQRKALTVCATHFTDLTDLALLYPQAQNINLAVRADGQRLTSLFQVESGASAPALEDYGIRVAELVGFPQSVIAQARAVAAELRNRVATRVRASAQPSTRQHHTLLVKLLALKHASLPEPAMRSFLLDLRRQFSPPQAPPPTPPRSAQEAAAELS